MRSFITLYFCLINAAVLFAVPQPLPLKIISPSSGSSLHFGASINITVEIPVGSIHSANGMTLGFSLNSTNLNGTLLGLIDTAQNPFSPRTGRLSCEFKIPPQGKFHSNSTPETLVASYYVSHIPVSTLASMPIALTNSQNSTKEHPEVISIPKSEVNASISAKGHNTGDTIPRIVVPVKDAPVGITNSSSAPVKAPTSPTVTNPTSQQTISNGTHESTPISSGATRMSISAVFCAIVTLSIFSSTL